MEGLLESVCKVYSFIASRNLGLKKVGEDAIDAVLPISVVLVTVGSGRIIIDLVITCQEKAIGVVYFITN